MKGSVGCKVFSTAWYVAKCREGDCRLDEISARANGGLIHRVLEQCCADVYSSNEDAKVIHFLRGTCARLDANL